MSAVTASVPRMVQSPEKSSHKRTKSSHVLKAMIPSKGHKKAPSDGSALLSRNPAGNPPHNPMSRANAMPMLPPDHPHAGQRVLGEIRNPSGGSPTKESRPKGLHKKTLSSVSLRSLGKEKESDNGSKNSKDLRGHKKPSKTKSALGLAGVFAKNKSQKDLHEGLSGRDKENTTPPGSALPIEFTPIWAQFRTAPYQEISTTASVPLNDRKSIEEEIRRYTPKEYSPSKQRNFYDEQPALHKPPSREKRPQTMFLPSTTTSLFDQISRKMSSERERPVLTTAKSSDSTPTARGFLHRSSSEKRAVSTQESKPAHTMRSKGSRVMAAVAAINGKGKEAPAPEKLDPAKIAAEFERVLDSRNIPDTMRPKMRALADNVKADFIKKNKVEQPPQPEKKSSSKFAAVAETVSKRVPTLGRSAKQSKPVEDEDDTATDDNGNVSSKRERPLSKAFSFSKGASPIKKQKQDGWASHRSSKSIDLPKSPSTRSLVSVGSNGSVKAPKQALPEEYVSYLQRTRKPQDVEVGKLHKLRLLLRNETVSWVDGFVEQSGMDELVNLLHRIMEIEWREEHEDTLMHEVLLCLKGLCTTDSALQKLSDIAPVFFPALLKMLFDEEHKGPSEFTTRGLIISLLYAHLSDARSGDLSTRARIVLDYLKDPVPEEDRRPLPFILEMHQSRPYKIWCKEITNVTKEVFWIFLHHVNVVPLPPEAKSDADSLASSNGPTSYARMHFPQPRPPVPAAPYVGGVEWDATNYMATHVDLVNGLIASLPTIEERNALRTELRASGFEKVFGGALRTCKEKFYPAVHDGLRIWVKAALEDEWDVRNVRMGLSEGASSPIKAQARTSPKKKAEPAPKLKLPPLELGDGQTKSSVDIKDEWIGV